MSTPPRAARPDARGFPAPSEGFVLTHLLIVSDQDRSRDFYRRVLGAEVIRERDPVALRVSNSWIILNAGGGPTEDKPNVIVAPPQNSNVLTSIINLRVADIWETYRNWQGAAPNSLPSPKDRGGEIRCYMRDPDGHLIELGQATGILEARGSDGGLSAERANRR